MTSRSNKQFSQEQLIKLEKAAAERLDDLIECLGLDLNKASKFYVGQCPIHGGDNKSAFNIFHTGYETVGNWRCFTHNCHMHFQPTILGFVRGYLSTTKYGWSDTSDSDKECSFPEAVKFLMKFIKCKDLSEINIDDDYEEKRLTQRLTNIYNPPNEPEQVLNISREQIRKALKIPAPYFINRNYDSNILDKYDVGYCDVKNKPMYQRCVVPIYNNDYTSIVGCTGRSIFDACSICGNYHNPLYRCPDDKYAWQYKKWRNNKGFYAENYFYNYWFAKDHIRKSGVAIIVESPGNIWKLVECGIHNCIATFGAHLTEKQKSLLDKSGAMYLILLMDPDSAGRTATNTIKQMCENLYGIYTPNFGLKDISDTQNSIIEDKIVSLNYDLQKELGTL